MVALSSSLSGDEKQNDEFGVVGEEQEDGKQQALIIIDGDNNTRSIIRPGDSKPDLRIEVVGSLIYCSQLSRNLALFTLYLEEEEGTKKGRDDESSSSIVPFFDQSDTAEVIDVVLKRDNGWEPDSISEIQQHLDAVMKNQREETTTIPTEKIIRVQACGFLERMRAKFSTDITPLRLHALTVQVENIVYNRTTGVTAQPSNSKATTITTEQQQQQQQLPLENNITSSTLEEEGASSFKKTFSGAKDKSRLGKFAQFLLSEFGGYDVLTQKPVLDVAGGTGGLSFELSNRHGIPSVVVDTREAKLTKQQKRHKEFRLKCLQALDADPENARKSPLVRNLRNRFVVQDPRQFKTLLDSTWILPRQSGETSTSSNDDHHHHLLNEAQRNLRSMLHDKNCSVMVGLHPDQATDPIIDIGLALGIPWAVVPCCVFPNLFTLRRTPSGKVVRSYDDLCDYILGRDPSIQEATLPFRGRNRVFYWHPPPPK